MIAWCREQMANYKVPRAVEIVDALPINASGKVMKFELRERSSLTSLACGSLRAGLRPLAHSGASLARRWSR